MALSSEVLLVMQLVCMGVLQHVGCQQAVQAAWKVVPIPPAARQLEGWLSMPLASYSCLSDLAAAWCTLPPQPYQFSRSGTAAISINESPRHTAAQQQAAPALCRKHPIDRKHHSHSCHQSLCPTGVLAAAAVLNFWWTAWPMKTPAPLASSSVWSPAPS